MPGQHMLTRCTRIQASCDCTCLDVGFEAFDAGARYGTGGLIDPPPTWFQSSLVGPANAACS
jgi:hypothetical protein